MYDVLDNAILNVIAGYSKKVSFLRITNNEYVHAESFRLEELMNRKRFRILDGRLQALRKKRIISFNSKEGWIINEKIY